MTGWKPIPRILSRPLRGWGGEAIEEGEDFLLEVVEGFGGAGAVEVVDAPVLDVVDEVGEATMHERSVLVLFHGDDMVGRVEVVPSGVFGKAEVLGVGQPHRLEPGEGVDRHWAEVVQVEGEAA
jgi:hypothetical protein